MERMLGRSRPFYKAGPVMRLQKIPAEPLRRFIEARFRATRLRPAPGWALRSSNWQAICPTTFSASRTKLDDAQGRKSVGVDDLHETLRRLLGEHDAIFEATWQRLTLAQRAALRGAVLEEGHELLAADVRTRYRLGGPRPCRHRSRRWCVRTSLRAKARATSSSIRSFANGWRGRPTDVGIR